MLTVTPITVEATERMNWKRCHRMWWYSSRNGRYLEPLRPRAYFSFGTVVHAALAAWTAEPNAVLEHLYMKAAYAEVEKIKAQYHEFVGLPMDDTELTDTLEQLEMGQALMRAYQQHYVTPLPEGFRLISNEQECEIPVPGLPFGDSIKIRLDGLAADDLDYIYVIERKTFSPRFKPKPIDIDMNEQFTTYLWGAERLGLGTVGGLLYDGIKKQKPSAKGQVSDLFFRTVTTRNAAQLQEFEKYLVSDLLAIAAARDGNTERMLTTVPWNGCSDCAFQAPCLEESRGGDAEYILANDYKRRSDGDAAQ